MWFVAIFLALALFLVVVVIVAWIILHLAHMLITVCFFFAAVSLVIWIFKPRK
jgi:hypothetical protein